jgi:hypothetical protein
MKTITKKWLVEKNACQDGFEWFVEQNKEFEPVPLLYLLIKKNQLDWANWLIVRVMDYSQYVSYAVYAAELVIDIFEKQYPDDKRPRTAIEAAKKCIENPNEENKKEAANASWAAYSTADSASSAAYNAAKSAASAASAAYREAYWEAYWAADWAAGRVACAADRTAKSAKILKEILKYGIKLLTDKTKRRSIKKY